MAGGSDGIRRYPAELRGIVLCLLAEGRSQGSIGRGVDVGAAELVAGGFEGDDSGAAKDAVEYRGGHD